MFINKLFISIHVCTCKVNMFSRVNHTIIQQISYNNRRIIYTNNNTVSDFKSCRKLLRITPIMQYVKVTAWFPFDIRPRPRLSTAAASNPHQRRGSPNIFSEYASRRLRINQLINFVRWFRYRRIRPMLKPHRICSSNSNAIDSKKFSNHFMNC